MATQQAVDRRERRDARLGSVGEPRELALVGGPFARLSKARENV